MEIVTQGREGTYEARAAVSLRAGDIYVDGPLPPQDGATVMLMGGKLQLCLGVAYPCESEIVAVERDEIELALFLHASVLLLAYRIGGTVPWGDAVVPPLETTWPTSLPAELEVLLVDPRSSVVHATRGALIDEHFTGALREAATYGERAALDLVRQHQIVDELHRTSTPASIARQAQVHTTVAAAEDAA